MAANVIAGPGPGIGPGPRGIGPGRGGIGPGPGGIGGRRGFGPGIGGGIGGHTNVVTVAASVGEKKNAEVTLLPLSQHTALTQPCPLS